MYTYVSIYTTSRLHFSGLVRKKFTHFSVQMITERMYEHYQDAVNMVHQNCELDVEMYCNVNHVHLPPPSLPKKPLHSKHGLREDSHELPCDGVNMHMTNWAKAEPEPESYFGDVDEGEDVMIFVREPDAKLGSHVIETVVISDNVSVHENNSPPLRNENSEKSMKGRDPKIVYDTSVLFVNANEEEASIAFSTSIDLSEPEYLVEEIQVENEEGGEVPTVFRESLGFSEQIGVVDFSEDAFEKKAQESNSKYQLIAQEIQEVFEGFLDIINNNENISNEGDRRRRLHYRYEVIHKHHSDYGSNRLQHGHKS